MGNEEDDKGGQAGIDMEDLASQAEETANSLKEQALSNCNNWRGVTLLSVPSTILAILELIIGGSLMQWTRDSDKSK